MTPSMPPEPGFEAARQRLARLDMYLNEDPDNQALRTEAFEVALRCREWERAEIHLQAGKTSGLNELGWALREGDLAMAQENWNLAQSLLDSLRVRDKVPADFALAVLHNLAYIDFRTGAYADGVVKLSPVLEDGRQSDIHFALKLLWLRLLHHLGELDRACRWTEAQEKSGRIEAEVAGAASLIALDASDLAAARRWSRASLEHTAAGRPKSIEALVTQASLALAERNGADARMLADEALRINPNEGRTWSIKAFADFLDGNLPVALTHFERALSLMPQHIGTWHGKGWVQILMKDMDAAQSTFETALEMDRNFAESHGGLAVVFALKQQTREARSCMERALRLDPQNLSGRYAEAIMNGEVQDANALLRFAQRLLGTRTGPLGRRMSEWLPGHIRQD